MVGTTSSEFRLVTAFAKSTKMWPRWTGISILVPLFGLKDFYNFYLISFPISQACNTVQGRNLFLGCKDSCSQTNCSQNKRLVLVIVVQFKAAIAHSSHLGGGLQAVLQVFAKGVVGEEGEPRQVGLPHAYPLVESVEELVHCGGAIKPHHLQQNKQP